MSRLTYPENSGTRGLEYARYIRSNFYNARNALNDAESYVATVEKAMEGATQVQIERDALAAAVRALMANLNGDLVDVYRKHPIIDAALRS